MIKIQNFFKNYYNLNKIICPICFEDLNYLKTRNIRLLVTNCGHVVCSCCYSKLNCVNRSIKKCHLCRKLIDYFINVNTINFCCLNLKYFSNNVSEIYISGCGHLICKDCKQTYNKCIVCEKYYQIFRIYIK